MTVKFTQLQCLSQKEIESMENGNLFVLDWKGTPVYECKNIWFVWYREKNNKESDYRILMKSMKSKKEESISLLNIFRKQVEDFESDLGYINMFTGEMVLLKQETEKTNES